MPTQDFLPERVYQDVMTIISAASTNDDKITIVDSDADYIGNVDDEGDDNSIAVCIENLHDVADIDEIDDESNSVQLMHFDGETMV